MSDVIGKQPFQDVIRFSETNISALANLIRCHPFSKEEAKKVIEAVSSAGITSTRQLTEVTDYEYRLTEYINKDPLYETTFKVLIDKQIPPGTKKILKLFLREYEKDPASGIYYPVAGMAAVFLPFSLELLEISQRAMVLKDYVPTIIVMDAKSLFLEKPVDFSMFLS